MTDQRMYLLNELVDEITKDRFDEQTVRGLLQKLNIPFTEDPLQLLNNILKGIHTEGPKNESSI